MHKIRSDSKYLKYMYSCPNAFNRAEVERYQELPLVVMTPAEAHIADKAAIDVCDKQKVLDAVKSAREGLYLIKTLSEDNPTDLVVFYCHVNITLDGSLTLDAFSELPIRGKPTFGYVASFIIDRDAKVTLKPNGNNQLSFKASVNARLCTHNYAMEVADRLRRTDAKESIPAMLMTLLDLIGGLFLWLEQNQTTRPVAVRNVSTDKAAQKTAAKKPWLRTDLTEIKFLDRLPSPSSGRGEHQGGTHASPKKHFRQAGKRTLRHPRYRNHPLYGVEKAVPVRSAWVGKDQSVVVNGTEYHVTSLTKENISNGN